MFDVLLARKAQSSAVLTLKLDELRRAGAHLLRRDLERPAEECYEPRVFVVSEFIVVERLLELFLCLVESPAQVFDPLRIDASPRTYVIRGSE